MSGMLIIPSAKLIPEELRFEFGSIPPCLLPFNNDIAINQIIRDNKEREKDIFLAINEGDEKVIEFFQEIKNELRFINVGFTKSLGDTIYNVLDKVISGNHNYSSLTIQFADTIIPDLSNQEENESVILYSKANQLYRWTSFEVIDNSLVITDKKSQDQFYSNVFIGRFYFQDLQIFYNFLKDTLFDKTNGNSQNGIDPFYSAIVLYHKKYNIKFIEVTNWFDIGHIDNYYRSKKLFVNTRFFNSFHFNEKNNTIIKRTLNESKLVDEIKWFLNLPDELQFLTPRIYNHSLKRDNVYYEMEYYGYSNLGELFLFSDIDISLWDDIIKKIFSLLDLLRTFKDGTLKKTQINQIYKAKTIERLNFLGDLDDFKTFWDESITINDINCKGLEYIMPRLDEILSGSGLFSERNQTIIHGDFCLSNILYDIRYGIFKLIDPRGSFGIKGIYGDYLYDVAKLTHSFLGGYEFLINNRFKYSYENGSHYYQIFYTKHQKQIQELYLKNIADYLSINDLKSTYLIQALLYLSMIPLHMDDSIKQKAMLAQGLFMINDIIQE